MIAEMMNTNPSISFCDAGAIHRCLDLLACLYLLTLDNEFYFVKTRTRTTRLTSRWAGVYQMRLGYNRITQQAGNVDEQHSRW